MQHLIINEIFEGGSMGKGTTVLDDFDVDLVIYSSSMLLVHKLTSVHM